MITTLAAVLVTWTAASIPAGVLIGRRLRHLTQETTMFVIPADLDRWHPNDINRWLRDIEDDENISDAEFESAMAAVDAALLGTTGQA
ncbi:hypothetical protein ACIOC1_00275 [Streptomyces sp. NPDC088197]|uniref:hypothetical protein n=1 Tax=Streptomyces sp. NPDC088197 TaxID=3365840 RepID=UPI00382F25CF